MARSHSGFFSGLVYGLLVTSCMVCLGWLLSTWQGESIVFRESWPEIYSLVTWLADNFGWSVIPFTITFLLYMLSIRKLSRLVRNGRSLVQVSQMEHMTDIWINLFFGIGVIWTAIGMRGALLYALGDTQAMAGGDALRMLDRMVDGGMLTALSTTIVGGVGGYLMRILKTCLTGAQVKQYYHELETSQHEALRKGLERIEANLDTALISQHREG